MAPKKADKRTGGAQETKSEKKVGNDHDTSDDKSKHTNANPKASVPAKRKQPEDSQDGSEKAARRSNRGKAKPDATKVVKFLLSDKGLDLARPKDEKEDIEKRGSIKTYSASELNPFEELLSAVVLSRPISHALGVRSIRTIFNDPYNFSSPKAILDAGEEKVHQSLWDARTQHKGKTADQITLVAKVISEKFSKGNTNDDSLDGVRKEAGKDMDEESDLLTSNIKGIGKTGMSIFFRRIQWLWHECYPYVDDRTSKALEELGLPKEAEKLVKIINENWSDLKSHFKDHEDEVGRKRAFVVLLERAVGIELEKNISAVLE